MLDETFGYRAEAFEGTPWECKLRQDRYMVLWRVFVEGRLCRAGHAEDRQVAALRHEFDRAFVYRGVRPPTSAFDRVLHATALTHVQLSGWAIAPQSLLFMDSAGAMDAGGPGGLCPLCGFPTYDWFDFGGNAGGLAQFIQCARPAWCTAHGACRQCAETYASQRRAGGGFGQRGEAYATTHRPEEYANL
jgi:hypothetical protein